MNKKLTATSLWSIGALASLIAGCGPQDANDLGYLDAMADSGVLNKDVTTDRNDQLKLDVMPDPPGTASCNGNCDIPPDPDTVRRVQLPDTAETQPTKIIKTDEVQIATDIVDHHTTHHIYEPVERHHTVNKHRHQENRHFTKVVHHPSYRRINEVVRTASSRDEVMPIEEVVAPLVDLGCGEAVQPVMVQPVIIRPVPIVMPFFR